MENNDLKSFVVQHYQDRGLSLRSLASAVGFSHNYISNILNGKRLPSAKILNRLADFFEIPRVSMYMAAGWIEPQDTSATTTLLSEMQTQTPQIDDLVRCLGGMPVDKRIEVLEKLLPIAERWNV